MDDTTSPPPSSADPDARENAVIKQSSSGGGKSNWSEGIIGWFAHNHVAANLMMAVIILGGLYTIFFNLKKETMPTWSFDVIQVVVPFRGGTPEEVEEGVLIKVEEAVKSVEGIGTISSRAYEGQGDIRIDISEGYELQQVLDEVKLAVDAISSFPSETERPVIREYSPSWRQVLNVQVYGDLDEFTLKDITEDLRNEILELPNVSYADVLGTRTYEISVEVSEANLQRYGLSLGQVAQIIRQWSVDVPGGGIRTEGGYIRVRAKGQAHTGEEYADIILRTALDGSVVRLGDIATIIDGFSETQSFAFFNGKRSLGIGINARQNENSLQIAKEVREFVEQRKQTLPSSVQIDIFGDSTYYLADRLNMMLKNLGFGAILVFLMLGLFLRVRIALWVIIGLPVAFLGACLMLPLVGQSINMISLFGFIVVIGIVVDDAIIIAESAHAETDRHGYTTDNIIHGARRVALPATFGVLTTVAAFGPMLNAGGRMAVMFAAIGWVVVFCLLFSLIESKLILPSHLALMKSSIGKRRGIADWMDGKLRSFINNTYLPFLKFAVQYRYICVSAFTGLLILTAGFALSPFFDKGIFPRFENDFIFVDVSILEGSPESLVVDILEQMTAAVDTVNAEIMEETGATENPIKHVFAFSQGSTQARLNAELAKPDARTLSPTQIANRWRETVGNIAGTEQLSFSAEQRFSSGAPIAFNLSGKNFDALDAAGEELAEHLATYDGVFEIRTPIAEGPEEIRLRIKPEGVAAGLTRNDLGRQVREAFYGVESQRIQRGESELRVVVRYPQNERRSIGNLESMLVRLPDGSDAPFYSVADFSIESGYGAIRRTDGRRAVSITADVDANVVSAFSVTNNVTNEFLPQLFRKYPSVKADLAGGSRDEILSLKDIGLAFLVALVLIYGLMAIPLRSYLQPIVIMSVIPFGLIGAVAGHVIVQSQFNLVSMIGCIALSGVVVNDSLILVHYVNRKQREEGASLLESILSAGKARLRAILLTSLTTFFGLVPILLEQSLQAQIVTNIAVSLGFGILFATLITLVFIPCLLRVIGDLKRTKNADIIADEDFQLDSRLVGTPAGN